MYITSYIVKYWVECVQIACFLFSVTEWVGLKPKKLNPIGYIGAEWEYVKCALVSWDSDKVLNPKRLVHMTWNCVKYGCDSHYIGCFWFGWTEGDGLKPWMLIFFLYFWTKWEYVDLFTNVYNLIFC